MTHEEAKTILDRLRNVWNMLPDGHEQLMSLDLFSSLIDQLSWQGALAGLDCPYDTLHLQATTLNGLLWIEIKDGQIRCHHRKDRSPAACSPQCWTDDPETAAYFVKKHLVNGS